jgi:hypothetical protein
MNHPAGRSGCKFQKWTAQNVRSRLHNSDSFMTDVLQPVAGTQDLTASKNFSKAPLSVHRRRQEKCCVRPLASESLVFEEVDGGGGYFKGAELHVEWIAFVSVPFQWTCPEGITRFCPNTHNHAASGTTLRHGCPQFVNDCPHQAKPDSGVNLPSRQVDRSHCHGVPGSAVHVQYPGGGRPRCWRFALPVREVGSSLRTRFEEAPMEWAAKRQ